MRRASFIAVLLLLVAACTADPIGSSSTPPPAASGAPSDIGSGSADALAFSAETLGGDAFDGGAYAGQDLMLWFWAPW